MTQADSIPRETPPRAARLRRRAAIAALWIGLSALLTLSVGSAFAQTNSAPQVSLEAAETFLPTDGSFDYSANVFVTTPVDSMQVRLQVLSSSGKIAYQRTQYATNIQPGLSSFTFSRDLAELHLSPGIYAARVTVKTSNDTSTDTTSATTSLMLYDSEGTPTPVAVVVRVHGAPLFGPDNALASDPAAQSDVVNQVRALAAYVSARPGTKLTLAVPPVLLDEWKQLAKGYTVPGHSPVNASDSQAQAYSMALEELAAAMHSGHLEVVSEGYADPNLADMASHSLSADVSSQYAAGTAAFVASVGSTPSAGSAPAGGAIPSQLLSSLAEQGVGYVVVGSEYASVDSRPAASGVYPIQGSPIRAVVADYNAKRALASDDTSQALSKVFERYLAPSKGPFVVCVDVGDNEETGIGTVEDFLGVLSTQPWAQMVLAEDAAAALPKGAANVELKTDASDKAPTGYWQTLQTASSYSAGLTGSLPPGDADGLSAARGLLLAESSAWKGADGNWKRATEGLSFADASLGVSKGIFGSLYVRAESITLAGTEGNVPINIGNNTQKTLKVTIVTDSSGGVGVAGSRSFETTLPPQETFVQVPVRMTSSSGKLKVDVMAGDLLVASQTITVKASYLDRIAIIAAVVGGLIIMLLYIRKKTRVAEDAEASHAAKDAEETREG